jgi:glycosyltransferase involved in cell wall biosynthesis
MKILQVVQGFPPDAMAGTELYTHDLSMQLSKNNEVFVFYRTSDTKKKEYDLTRTNSEGLDAFAVNNTFRFCNSFEQLYRNDAIARQFALVLDEIKPDIIHIQHLIFLSTTIIGEIKKRKIPVVFTLHDYWLICPQWHFLKKDLTICDNNEATPCINCLDQQLSIKALPKKFYLFLRDITPGFFMRFLKNIYLDLTKINQDDFRMLENVRLRKGRIKKLCSEIDLFIAPSLFIRRKFIEFGIPEGKIKFITHGINKESFRGFRRKPSDGIRFGFVGTILPAKGVDILINAFNRLKDNNAELRIYGKLFPYQGFEYYPGFLKRLVRGRRIRFMGGVDHNDISAVFSEIDVLALPSIWNENCPLVILEAFLAGVPLIASRIGGIPELVSDGVDGILFQPGDVEGLYHKMQLLVSQPDMIDKLKRNISQVKNISDHAKEIEEIYSGLLTAKSYLS